MTQQITDFTKSKLTQAFEAKGNAGSSLIEQIQPVVVVHSLETGPFTPSWRWTWCARIPAVAAQMSIAQIAPSNIQSENTCIIDFVYADQNCALFFPGSGRVAPDTVQGTLDPVAHDLRIGTSSLGQRLTAHFGVDQGGLIGIPLGSQTIGHIGTPAGTMARFDLGVTWALAGFSSFIIVGAAAPALLIATTAVNVAFNVTVHGRLFPVQS